MNIALSIISAILLVLIILSITSTSGQEGTLNPNRVDNIELSMEDLPDESINIYSTNTSQPGQEREFLYNIELDPLSEEQQENCDSNDPRDPPYYGCKYNLMFYSLIDGGESLLYSMALSGYSSLTDLKIYTVSLDTKKVTGPYQIDEETHFGSVFFIGQSPDRNKLYLEYYGGPGDIVLDQGFYSLDRSSEKIVKIDLNGHMILGPDASYIAFAESSWKDRDDYIGSGCREDELPEEDPNAYGNIDSFLLSYVGSNVSVYNTETKTTEEVFNVERQTNDTCKYVRLVEWLDKDNISFETSSGLHSVNINNRTIKKLETEGESTDPSEDERFITLREENGIRLVMERISDNNLNIYSADIANPEQEKEFLTSIEIDQLPDNEKEECMENEENIDFCTYHIQFASLINDGESLLYSTVLSGYNFIVRDVNIYIASIETEEVEGPYKFDSVDFTGFGFNFKGQSPDGNKLYFYSNTLGAGDALGFESLYSLDRTTKKVTKIDFGLSEEIFIKDRPIHINVSPDASYIAFSQSIGYDHSDSEWFDQKEIADEYYRGCQNLPSNHEFFNSIGNNIVIYNTQTNTIQEVFNAEKDSENSCEHVSSIDWLDNGNISFMASDGYYSININTSEIDKIETE